VAKDASADDLEIWELIFNMQESVRLRVPDGGLGSAMETIRTWLDGQHIQPTSFRTMPDGGGYLLTITFYAEHEADRFRRRFAEGLGTPGT
jgi:hypothetical protein